MHHIIRNTLIASILIAFVVFGSYIGLNVTGRIKDVSSPVSTQISEEIQKTAEAQEKEVKATSLDGGKTLTMKTKTGEGGITEYAFSVDGNSPFFSETLDSSSSMNLTYNSWSPDGKYVYVAVNKNGVKDAYVFNAGAEDFADGKKYMSAQEHFAKRNINYSFDEATGWGGIGLVQIKSIKEDGSRGPNFWFEIPSGAVLQLAH